MFKLQHQFNNIVETTQLTNNLITEFYCHCECSKCPPPDSSSNTSLQSLNLLSFFYSLVDESLWQVAPDNLKRFLDFGDCFRLCFKLAVSLQHCTSHVIFDDFWGQWSFVMKSGQLARSQFHAALRAVYLARRPAERWIRWAAGDCFQRTII